MSPSAPPLHRTGAPSPGPGARAVGDPATRPTDSGPSRPQPRVADRRYLPGAGWITVLTLVTTVLGYGALLAAGWAGVQLLTAFAAQAGEWADVPADTGDPFDGFDVRQVLVVLAVAAVVVAGVTLVLSLVVLTVMRRAGWFRPLPPVAQGTLAWLTVQGLGWALLQLVLTGATLVPLPAGWGVG